MKSFEHVDATTAEDAVRLLGTDGSARPIAGGTDLLTAMKLGIVAPRRLVNLKTIPDLDYVRYDEREGLRLGALATLDAIAADPVVQRHYPALVRAISAAASPQLRNAGTLGGNLGQASRCWYYRGPFHCWLKGGEVCHAKEGENAHHAILGGGPCYTVHPSDTAPALIALDAAVRVVGPGGERTIPLERLFRRPSAEARRLLTLGPADLVVEVRLPSPAGSRSTYLKAMDRQVWAFALASVAAQVSFEAGRVRDARVVLGGVAPTPWRVSAAEAALRGSRLEDRVLDLAAAAAVAGASPLRDNGYKLPLVKGLVRQALAELRP